MIFYKNYNPLMYLKVIITIWKPLRKVKMIKIAKDFSKSFFENFDSNHNLLDIEKNSTKFSINQYYLI